MIKITNQQKKILYISAIVLLVFVFYMSFIYQPQSRKLTSLKKELENTENQIEEIMRLVQGQDLTDAVKKLKIDFDKASNKLPKGEEEVIRSLSEEANRLKIKVKNITASDAKLLDIQVAGRKIAELPISMKLTCEYNQLGEYLNALRNNLPALVQVKQVDIKGSGEGNSELDIDLNILAYLSKGN